MTDNDTVKVAMIGTGNGATIPSGTVAQTPNSYPNLVVKVVSPFIALLIGFAYAYGTALLGLITAAGFSQDANMLLSGGTGNFFTAVHNSLTLALAGASFDLLKNIVVILGKLKEKFPIASGSLV
jgi:hypothetical protein